MSIYRIATAVLVLCVAGPLAGMALAWRAPIAPIFHRDVPRFDQALIRRGAELAAIGNCAVCHTAPGGHVLAGGRALATPFGTIYSTNITPDADTGIGRWSERAFARASVLSRPWRIDSRLPHGMSARFCQQGRRFGFNKPGKRTCPQSQRA